MEKFLFDVEGCVEMFDKEKPWVFVRVPRTHSDALARFADRGLIAIHACMGSSDWNTSLMPMGDGTHFIPLPQKVRQKEGIATGDRVAVGYTLRAR